LAEGPPDFTPVTLITGCLGSGKTTLLQRLLRDPALSDTAVLINEFGEVGLDHYLLERIDERIVMLQSGCVCCTIRGELSAAIKDLHSRRERGLLPPFRRLVIESTGLADPFPILSTVQSGAAASFLSWQCDHDRRCGERRAAARRATRKHQAGRGGRSAGFDKDRSGDCRRDRPIDAALASHQFGRTAVAWAEDELDADALLSGQDHGSWQPAEADDAMPDGHHRHADDIRTLALRIEERIDWARFGLWLTMLLNRHGEALLRVKGILNVADAVTPVAVHAVQHLVHTPRHLAAWPDQDRRSRLILIARGLDPAVIERSFRAFVIAKMKRS